MIDRRVRVVQGSDIQKSSILRVSDLRSEAFVVLLGEPGSGKSTVFRAEANLEGAQMLRARELLNGTRLTPNSTLFVDALDEYRADGSAADKAYQLARTLAAAELTKWRISCRAEDWRKEADSRPLEQAATNAPIVVAQLQPLELSEASFILASLGHDDPETFIKTATSLGAQAFLQNPLSLQLLAKAVSKEARWPKNRDELFASAIHRLSHEHDKDQAWFARNSPEKIVAAAARACLFYLTVGARALWRSNSETPSGGADSREFLTAHDLNLDATLLSDMLDTPLFKGEGDVFEPMHRTIAEYLGGQALAQAIVGANDRAAVPISRALALITASDLHPVTDLRGLYAWCATHLSKLGADSDARLLVEADAFTVLAYGDAAAISTSCRRSILANLDREDPYFRMSENGDTALGGLAGEDISPELRSILESPPAETHQLLTVFDALTVGQKVDSLKPVLHHIAIDPARPEWQRWRATDAWLTGELHPEKMRRKLFDELSSEPVSPGREMLRLHLAAAIPSSLLSAGDIRTLLTDFQSLPEDNTVGRIAALRKKLEAEPRPDLFDEPLLLVGEHAHSHRYEVESLLDHALSAAIIRTLDLSAARLWRWTRNVRDEPYSDLGKAAARAITLWLDAHSDRESELFFAIFSDLWPTERPGEIWIAYIHVARRSPSTSIIRKVLAMADAADASEKLRLLELAFRLVGNTEAYVDVYWEVFAALQREPGGRDLQQAMIVNEIPTWRLEDQARSLTRENRRNDSKNKNLRVLSPLVSALREGGHLGHLSWAADIYLRSLSTKSDTDPLDRVRELTNQEISEAIATGWRHLATASLRGVTAARLGKAAAKGQSYLVEDAVIAGIDHLLVSEQMRPVTGTLGAAIIALKSSWRASNGGRQERIEEWAIQRLNQEPSEGAAVLFKYWNGFLNAGGHDFRSAIGPFYSGNGGNALALAIEPLLRRRSDLTGQSLHAALKIAIPVVPRDSLLELATSRAEDKHLSKTTRVLWLLVAFAFAPDTHVAAIIRAKSSAEVLREAVESGLLHELQKVGGNHRYLMESAIVQVLGRSSSPPDWKSPGLRGHVHRTVTEAIKVLAASPSEGAGRTLHSLAQRTNLTEWSLDLRHAQALQASVSREQTFVHVTPDSLRTLLDGGPPANAADLFAVATEELSRLSSELHSTDNMPWKRYWNLDAKGRPKTPRHENECRDHLLGILRDRLRPYKIGLALPEVRRGEDTRADVVIATGAGRNLPIEVKRHYNREIWTAAITQLQTYAADPGSDGFGILLVIWFGVSFAGVPKPPVGTTRPTTAVGLQRALQLNLPDYLANHTKVLVFDASNPKANTVSRRRRKGARRIGADTKTRAPRTKGKKKKQVAPPSNINRAKSARNVRARTKGRRAAMRPKK